MKLINLLLVAAGLASIYSCEKDKEDDEVVLLEGDIGYASSHSYMHSVNNDIISIAETAMAYGNGPLSTCANVTHNTAQKKLTIDFGISSCKGPDGRSRRGKIIVNYTGTWGAAGTSQTFTFDKYKIDDAGVYGSFTLANKGTNGDGQKYCTMTGKDTIVEYILLSDPEAGKSIFQEMNLTRTWVEGANTTGREDDVFAISGDAKIKGYKKEYSSIIRSPLKKTIECKFMSHGEIELNLPDIDTRFVDYGTGACDNKAEIIIKGKRVSVDVGDF